MISCRGRGLPRTSDLVVNYQCTAGEVSQRGPKAQELCGGGVLSVAFLLGIQLEKAERRKQIHPTFDPGEWTGLGRLHQLG